MDPAILGEAYRFWFGDLTGPDDYPQDKSGIWFKRSEATDAAIAEQFGGVLDEVHAAAWDLDALTREQKVGLVIMLDQFPRNLFRESGQAFAYDARAREIARALIASGLANFYQAERQFLVMPLMHSEDIRDQDECAALVAQEALTCAGDAVERTRSLLDYAFWHRDLIRKFGRFPHRNAVLGRTSSEKETTHLAQKGRGY